MGRSRERPTTSPPRSATSAFTIGEVGNSSEPFPRTALFYAPGSEQAALRVVAHLSSRAQLVEDVELDENEVILVAGPDFTTVHEQPSTEDLSDLLPTATTPSSPESTTTTVATTTTSEPVGYTPDDAPAGVNCR